MSIREELKRIAAVPEVPISDGRHIGLKRDRVRNPASEESHRQLEARKLKRKLALKASKDDSRR